MAEDLEDLYDEEIAARFAELDTVDVPDLGARTQESRVESVDAGDRRFLTVAAAMVLAIGGLVAVVAGNSRDDDRAGTTQPDRTTPTSLPSSQVPVIEGYEAVVEPARSAPGDTITVTPLGSIEPVCLNLAMVYATTPPNDAIGILSGDGSWAASPPGTPDTFPGCAPLPSDDPASYVVPDELADGTYLICLSWRPTRAGCGPLVVERERHSTTGRAGYEDRGAFYVRGDGEDGQGIFCVGPPLESAPPQCAAPARSASMSASRSTWCRNCDDGSASARRARSPSTFPMGTPHA